MYIEFYVCPKPTISDTVSCNPVPWFGRPDPVYRRQIVTNDRVSGLALVFTSPVVQVVDIILDGLQFGVDVDLDFSAFDAVALVAVD